MPGNNFDGRKYFFLLIDFLWKHSDFVLL
jgi:hypothetical protein